MAWHHAVRGPPAPGEVAGHDGGWGRPRGGDPAEDVGQERREGARRVLTTVTAEEDGCGAVRRGAGGKPVLADEVEELLVGGRRQCDAQRRVEAAQEALGVGRVGAAVGGRLRPSRWRAQQQAGEHVGGIEGVEEAAVLDPGEGVGEPGVDDRVEGDVLVLAAARPHRGVGQEHVPQLVHHQQEEVLVRAGTTPPRRRG